MRLNHLYTALIVAGLTLSACGDSSETNENEATNNTDVNNTTPQDPATNNNSGDVDNSDKNYETSYQLKFDTLEFDDDSPGQLANPIIEQNFDESLDFPIIVLLDFK